MSQNEHNQAARGSFSSSAATTFGGSESYTIHIAGQLTNEFQVQLISGKGESTQDFEALRRKYPIQLLRYPLIKRNSIFASLLHRTGLQRKINPFDLEALSAAVSIGKIREFLEDTDILEVNYPTESLLFPFLPKRIKKIIHFHGPWLPPIYNRLKRFVHPHTDGFITCGQWSKSMLTNAIGIGSDIDVVFNGVDTNQFAPHEVLDKSWTDSFKTPGFIVGTVGRLSSAKGTDILFQATKLLGKKVQCIALGPSETGFAKTLKTFNQETFFHAPGPVANQHLPKFYNSIDCFVLPSLFETFPITVLEAMACGKPVIASDVGGIPEIVTHQKNGLLVPPGNVNALSNAIETLMANEVKRLRMGSCARETAVQKFSETKTTDTLKQIYNRLLQGN